ncbi:MAG: hypothetical protein IPI01_13880 [Ignavibacteriae bacterium]|nr:hypothetical protein [Ignavibacteriota bacterium]
MRRFWNILTQSSIMSKFIIPTALIILGAVGVCAWLLSNYVSEQIQTSTTELVHARSEQALNVLASTHSLMKQRVEVAMGILRSEGDRLGTPGLGGMTRVGAESVPSLLLAEAVRPMHSVSLTV